MPPTVSASSMLSQFFTSVLVVVGWIVVDNQNNKRELRREIRALIDNLITEIDELAERSFKFHKNSTFDAIESKQLKLRIQRIANNINRNSLVENSKAIYHFRKSITGNNFDITIFRTQNDNSEILSLILEEKDELISALEEKYCNKYRKKL